MLWHTWSPLVVKGRIASKWVCDIHHVYMEKNSAKIRISLISVYRFYQYTYQCANSVDGSNIPQVHHIQNRMKIMIIMKLRVVGSSPLRENYGGNLGSF